MLKPSHFRIEGFLSVLEVAVSCDLKGVQWLCHSAMYHKSSAYSYMC